MINVRDYDEKRDHMRMKLDTPIQVKLDTGNYIEGTCLDLSVNGMQLELDRSIETGECIEACIPTGMGQIPDLVSKAIVVRTTRIGSERYVYGLQIESMH